MSEENVKIVREAAARFAQTREIGDLLAPDAVMVNAPGSPFSIEGTGPDAVREWVKQIDEAFEEWEWRPTEVLDTPGEKVVVLGRFWGRGRGMGIAGDAELNAVYTLADGWITGMEGYYTRAEALEAAGLSE